MDLDGDGHNDILSGSYSRHSNPMAGLFQVLWGGEDGSFQTVAVLTGTDGEPLIIPADENSVTETICTRPTAVDWDSDGDLDLVVGNFAGTFYLFTGEGEGRFLPKPTQIMVADDDPLRIHGAHSDPFPVDWDQDGDLDLVSGSSSGGVQWAENVAAVGETPALKQFASLIEPSDAPLAAEPTNGAEPEGPARSTRVWVDDVNSDGMLDVLVGDTVTLITLPEGVTEEESEKRQAEWQEQMNKTAQEYIAAADDEDKREELRAKLTKLQATRSEFLIEDRTGFVWLYLQK